MVIQDMEFRQPKINCFFTGTFGWPFCKTQFPLPSTSNVGINSFMTKLHKSTAPEKDFNPTCEFQNNGNEALPRRIKVKEESPGPFSL